MAVKNFGKYEKGQFKPDKPVAQHRHTEDRPAAEYHAEHQKGKTLKYVTGGLCAAGWFTAILAFGLLNMASPEKESIFTIITNSQLRTFWNVGLLNTALYILLGVTLVCVVTFLVNMLYYRKRPDSFDYALIVLSVLSLGAVGFFMWQHSSLLSF